MSYTENLILRTRDCDMNGHWKPSAILEAMQEVAIAHCDSIGMGRKVTDGLGVAWVLSRCRVELSRLPRLGEAYALQTYAMPTRHLFFPRAHVFRDGDGAVIGGAHSLWLLMDLETRQAVKEPWILEHLPVEGGVDVRQPGTVRPLNDAPVEGVVEPRFTDFDINGHVNNTRCMDWCWNALDFDGLDGRQVAAFEVNYDREIRRGEVIRTQLCREGDALTFCGFIGDTRCFGIRAHTLPERGALDPTCCRE